MYSLIETELLSLAVPVVSLWAAACIVCRASQTMQ